MTFIKIVMASLILFILLANMSCSSLLYYPSEFHYVTPKALDSEVEEVRFASEDGTALHGWYFKSKLNTEPKATIVFFHGNAQNISTHFKHLHWILEYPYDYFIFDYRGYGKSDGKPSPKGTLNDGLAAIRWTTNKFPDRPIIVLGQSLGGAIALSSVIHSESKEQIRAVVIDSSFQSYQEVARSVLSRAWILWPFQWLAYLLMSDEYAPEGKLHRLAPIPLLVIHGDRDSKVAFHLGESIYEDALSPKEFWRISGGRHTDGFTRFSEIRSRFLSYLDSVLKKTAKPAARQQLACSFHTKKFCRSRGRN